MPLFINSFMLHFWDILSIHLPTTNELFFHLAVQGGNSLGKYEEHKGFGFSERPRIFWGWKPSLGVKWSTFFGVNIFHFRSKIIFRGFMVSRIQRQLFICLHHSQSQEMPSNAMARAASATAGGIFFWGAPRRRRLWRPWPGEEKHLQLAQLQ